jgi:hypothetical protein
MVMDGFFGEQFRTPPRSLSDNYCEMCFQFDTLVVRNGGPEPSGYVISTESETCTRMWY